MVTKSFIFTKRTTDPIDLELFLGRLAIWGKFAGSPVIAYSVMRLPKHFDYYLSSSPLAKVELGLRNIYIDEIALDIVRGKSLKKMEFNSAGPLFLIWI